MCLALPKTSRPVRNGQGTSLPCLSIPQSTVVHASQCMHAHALIALHELRCIASSLQCIALHCMHACVRACGFTGASPATCTVELKCSIGSSKTSLSRLSRCTRRFKSGWLSNFAVWASDSKFHSVCPQYLHAVRPSFAVPLYKRVLACRRCPAKREMESDQKGCTWCCRAFHRQLVPFLHLAHHFLASLPITLFFTGTCYRLRCSGKRVLKPGQCGDRM